MLVLPTERELVAAARALGAERVGECSPAERRLFRQATRVAPDLVERLRAAIEQGSDPLGDAFTRLRAPADRRPLGATYTPHELVRAMTDWAAERAPSRVLDPGAGSGRFLVEAGRRFRSARLVGVELDPLAAVLLRAHLACAGFSGRAQVVCGDYRELALERARGSTLFLGNPPYVRHHAIDGRWKAWFADRAATLGLRASRLAGLHVHFLLATALAARPGDFGALLTSAEWLDVNYGACVRELLLGRLGCESLHCLDPGTRAFADADTTAAITCFEVGRRVNSIRVQCVHSIAELGKLAGGQPISRQQLSNTARWSTLTRRTEPRRRGLIELGELCRVHRGQVTGANRIWIMTVDAGLPESVLFPSITRARELFAAGAALSELAGLRRVIDLPPDLDTLSAGERQRVERFLTRARSLGADRGFIARHRKAWWSVGLREPAPILATYMARRAPAFVRNLAGARHLNIAHGLYPRERLDPGLLDALARYLTKTTSQADGRTYAGGLTKFEPREMERLLVPGPEELAATSIPNSICRIRDEAPA
jgi:hypothetical protein